jgi:6-phosphofructokinase
MAKKRIGILTGGGDVPGLNAVIKSVVYGCTSDYEVVGIRRGWMGLTHADLSRGPDPDYIVPLDRANTRKVDRTGGTFLHTSRTRPSRMRVDELPPKILPKVAQCTLEGTNLVDMTPVVLENLQRLKIDHLLAIGGDDTLSYAARLHSEGFPVMAVPKTMDNDVQNTEYCIGFSTALTRAVAAISRQRTTIGSHERIGIFRIFGRDSGFTALYTAYVASLRCCIPEVPFDLEKLISLLIEDKQNNESSYAVVVLSEGATWEGREVESYGEPDAYGHQKKVNVGDAFSDELKRRTGENTVVSDLTYDLRGGAPDFTDKMIAFTFANMAVECIQDGARGRMMAIQNGCYTDTDLPDPGKGARTVEIESMYNIERYRPSYRNKKNLPIFLTRV